MISQEEARAIARARIEDWNTEEKQLADHKGSEQITIALLDAPIAEGDFGWVFASQSVAFIKTGSFSDRLVGNVPLLVDRRTGTLFECGTADPIETYISNFLNYGHPHRKGGRKLRLLGWKTGANKIGAAKTIRDLTSCSLAEAKHTVDLCLDGISTLLECATPEEAKALATGLKEFNFDTKQLPNEDEAVAQAG